MLFEKGEGVSGFERKSVGKFDLGVSLGGGSEEESEFGEAELGLWGNTEIA